MFSRLFQRQAVRAQRNFSTSSAVRSIHFHDGLYTNIPFKVKGRKVPLAVPVSIYFGMYISYSEIYPQLSYHCLKYDIQYTNNYLLS